mgnify:CR=1 FL=1
MQLYIAELDLGVYVCGHGKLTLTSNTTSSAQALWCFYNQYEFATPYVVLEVYTDSIMAE